MLDERLRAVPFFRGLPGESLRALAAALRRHAHAPGDIVFREGDPAGAMYLVESGLVEVRRHGEALAALGPGSFVGELGLLLDEPRSADLVAITPTELWELRRETVTDLLDRHPAIGLELSRELGRRLVRTNARALPARPGRVVAHWGTGRDLDEFVAAVAATGEAPVVVAAGDPVPGETGERLVVAALAGDRGAAARTVLRAASLVVCSAPPPAWVLRRRDGSSVLRCDLGVPVARAARWAAGTAVGLALSSGGSKTVAHLGVVRRIEEEGIPIDAIAASSGGAMIGAALAAGIPHEARLRFLAEVADLLAVRRWDFNVPPRTGVMKGQRLFRALDRMLEGRTFADLDVPLSLVATDLATGGEVVLQSGSLAGAVRASIGIPGAFDPWRIGDRLLIDGAVVNPLPASVLRDRGLPVVIGSMVAGKRDDPGAPALTAAPSIMQTMLRMVNLMERELIEGQLPLVDLVIRPLVAANYSFDFTDIDGFIAKGERAAAESLAAADLPALRRRGR